MFLSFCYFREVCFFRRLILNSFLARSVDCKIQFPAMIHPYLFGGNQSEECLLNYITYCFCWPDQQLSRFSTWSLVLFTDQILPVGLSYRAGAKEPWMQRRSNSTFMSGSDHSHTQCIARHWFQKNGIESFMENSRGSSKNLRGGD